MLSIICYKVNVDMRLYEAESVASLGDPWTHTSVRSALLSEIRRPGFSKLQPPIAVRGYPNRKAVSVCTGASPAVWRPRQADN